MKVYYQNFGCYILRRKIKNIYLSTLKKLNIDFKGFSVNLKFVTNDEIQDLNKKYRDIDKVTDVLSFPNLELCKGKNINIKNLSKEINQEDGLVSLGDIAISKEVAKKQAKEYGHHFKREVCFLALHGFLHLLGFDHLTQEDEKEMQSLAEEILHINKVKRSV